jgi:hypothetical protein
MGQDLRTAFPRKYMSAMDLVDGEPLTAQIVSADMESFRNGEPALMLTLRHNGPQPKGVRANHTNRSILSAAWGPQTDGWINKKVELTVTSTAMGPGIAVRPISDGTQRTGGPSWNDSSVTARAAPPSYPPPPNPMPQKPRKPVGGGPIDDDPVPFAPCVQ